MEWKKNLHKSRIQREAPLMSPEEIQNQTPLHKSNTKISPLKGKAVPLT